MARKSISKRKRFEVLKRDGFRCFYCGRTPPEVVLQVDHVLAVAKGGTADLANLVTSCADCNLGKSDKDLTAIPEALEAQIQRTQEAVTKLRAHSDAIEEMMAIEVGDAWDVLEALDLWQLKMDKTVPSSWFRGVSSLLKRMPKDAMIRRASWVKGVHRKDKDRFLVFCKSCWNYVRRHGTQS